MRMTADVGIVVIPAVVGGNLLNLSGLLQQGQVAVNGAEADPRILLSDMLVNGLRCGMIFPVQQETVDSLPLTAVIICFHIVILSSIFKNNNSNYY